MTDRLATWDALAHQVVIDTAGNVREIEAVSEGIERVDLQQALREASAHVFRQQHAGTHEQDRADAREWMDRYGGGRCCCEKCSAPPRQPRKS